MTGNNAKAANNSLSGLKKLDPNCVYKVMNTADWETLRAQGSYTGSVVDLQDGYIHLSLASQVEATLDKHYADESDLVLVIVDARRLGSQLRWERARDEELFPHLYAELPVTACKPIAQRGLPEQGWQPMNA